MNIPFNKPSYDDRDEHVLVSALRSGHIVGGGQYTRRASERLADLLNVRTVLLTPSCTHALELAMMVLDLAQGDEVILPSFTFVSTANCVMRQGATVVFADISPTTLTLDIENVQRKITRRTKAIIPVVYAGIPPEMDELVQLTRNRGITIVEDAAQAIGATYRSRPQGTLGDIGCLSFHETKNITTGEGGAFITNNQAFASRAEIIREKGTNRQQFLLGQVDKYTWITVGSSYLPSELTCALLLSQLEKLATVNARREQIHQRYMQELAPLADNGKIALPTIPPYVKSNYHIFYVLMNDEETRNRALSFFKAKQIGTTFHYLPLHLSAVGTERLGYKPGDFPVTESVSSRLLRLPIYPSLTHDEQTYIIQSMKEFYT